MTRQGFRLLLVEDNPGDARLVREVVSESNAAHFEVVEAKRLSEALGRLAEERFDVILLDLGLPDSQGLDTIMNIRRQSPGAPIVVLTAMNEEASGLGAVQAGAQDYLMKGQIDGRTLVRATRYAIERTKRERADALRRSQSTYLWQSLMETLGRGASAVLYQAGTRAGSSAFDFIKEQWRPKDEGEFLRALGEHLGFAGLCDLRDLRIDRGASRATASVQHSFEPAVYGRRAAVPVCHFLRGLLCGVAGRLLGASDLVGDETSCEAMGDEICTFLSHPMFG